MFSFFKGSSKARSENDFSDTLPLDSSEPAASALCPPGAGSPIATLPIAGLPIPEVTEGNQEADWAAWQDSVSFQDSQFPTDYAPPAPPTTAKKHAMTEEQDAFSSVGRNAP